MKKVFQWFDAHDIAYDFHDYKKAGVDEAILKDAIAAHGWQSVINTRGMTWRKVPDDVKNAMSDQAAIALAKDKPSVVKRPLVVLKDEIYVGFDETVYEEAFLD